MSKPFAEYWEVAESTGNLDKALRLAPDHLREALKEMVKTRCHLAFNAGVRYGTGEMVTRLMERSPVGKEGE